MAILPASLDYTDKDFDAIKARLNQLIRSVFPTWTDQNIANFGNLLLESFSFVGDVLGFYQDNQAGESRWTTATQRRNLINMSKLIGFTAEGAAAATVDVVVTARDRATGGPPIGNVNIPAGTIISTPEITTSAVFQLLTDAIISAAADPSTATVTAENSANAQDIFESNGTPNQAFLLGESPFLDDSGVVVAADGTYTEEDDFLSSNSMDRHFTVSVDENDEATVRFGNGTSGTIPVGTITVDYKTGGGALQVEQNTVTQIEGQFVDDVSNPLTVSVTNPAESSGGQNRQTVEQIRVAAPESIRVVERSVAREDFEIVAKGVVGVARALMLSSDETTTIQENTGILFLIPEGGGVPSQALKDTVEAQFAKTGPFPKLLTFNLFVQDAVFLDFNILAKVFLADGKVEATVAATIRANLAAFFAVNNPDGSPNANIDFGFNFKTVTGAAAGEIPLSDVFNVVRDSAGLRKVGANPGDFTINLEHKDVPIALQEFPRLGTVTLINGDTGGFI